MGDATYPIFNKYMFIIIKIKANGGGGGILTYISTYCLYSVTQIIFLLQPGIHSGVQLGIHEG